jgi:endonuclease VIII
MPEGDTVWLTARRLHDALAGREVTESDFRVPAHATADLAGSTVHEVVSRGKHLLHRFTAGRVDPRPITLHTHLKMEGSWHLYRPGSRWRRPAHQARVILRTVDQLAVGFSLGICELVATADEERVVGYLGPDLLGPDWDLEEALRRLRSHPDRSVGEALLEQRNLAGIGTLYRSEALFVTGVHPETPVAAVEDLAGVVETARHQLTANREMPAQSTTGSRRRGEEHWVFKRSGQPCRRCGTSVQHRYLGPPDQERGVFWCPRCQPG